MRTDALVVQTPGDQFVYREVELDDEIRDNEILVQMVATGVCHTDLNFRHEASIPGLFPAVLGHEGAGIVLKKGSKATDLSVGDHVILSYSSCGDCRYCNDHETSYCYDFERDNFVPGRPADGSKSYSATSDSGNSGEKLTSHFFGQSSFAKYAVVMARSAIKVDRSLPLDLLAPLGCGVMTGAGAMLNVVQPKKGSIVLVVGTGAVGLAAIMAVKLSPTPPSKVIAVDIVPERLEMAKKYGATHTVNSREVSDLKDALLELTDGKGVDGAIDTTGLPAVVNSLLMACANKGKVVSVGVGKLTAEVSATIFKTVNTGRTYVGCAMGSCYPPEFIPTLIKAWQDGKFPYTDLIKHYPATEMETAAGDMLSGKVVKAVVKWS